MNNVVALAFSILTFAAPPAAARGEEDIHVEHRQQRDTITSRELAQQIDVARGALSRAEARRLRGDLQDPATSSAARSTTGASPLANGVT